MRALNTSRVWIVGAGVIGLLLVAATYLLVVSPARSDAADLRSKVDDASLVQTTLRHRLADLEAASKDSARLRSAGAAATAAIPVTADTQGLLRQVQATSAANRVSVGSVAISDAAATDVEGVWGLPVTIVLNGAPTDLVTVVSNLQATTGRALTIAGTTLTVVSDSASTLSLDVTMYSSGAPETTDGRVAGAPDAKSAPAAGANPTSGTTPSTS